jgi:GDP/UDP-N,N'-diacetylbacillosamine 2-epimerase (hydrolysing)
MKKILIFTSTRSEYGLLKWIIKSLSTKFKPLVTVGGTHLSYEDGYTIKEIISDQINNVLELPFLLSSRNCASLTISVGNGLIQMSQIFQIYKPDYTVLLGDRYELFIPSITSLLCNVPIIHLHGGEITEGAIDEQVRHALTKMAHIHMPSTEFYAENISNMGEEDWRIHIVGAPGLENAVRENLMSIKEIQKDLGLDITKPTILCTYHPVTLESRDNTTIQIKNIINALNKFDDLQIIFTRPNADVGSEFIIREIRKAVEEHKYSWFFFDSLGIRTYQSILKYTKAILGNSSSGITEASFFNIPSIDVGIRQRGRFKPKNVIECSYSTEEITKAIEKALYDQNFRNKIKSVKNLFGDGNTSEYVLRAFENFAGLPNEKILKKKLDFTVKNDEWHRYF